MQVESPADLNLFNFANQFTSQRSFRSLLICLACFVIIVILVIWFLLQLYSKPSRADLTPASQKKLKLYENVLEYIRNLEGVRLEREALLKKAVRTVQAWKYPDEESEAARTVKCEIEDLSDHVKALRREHQGMMKNCMAALLGGEHHLDDKDNELASVFKPDRALLSVWKKGGNGGGGGAINEHDEVIKEDRKTK